MNTPNNKALLPRMQARKHKNSTKVTYRYSPRPGTWIKLGHDYVEAIKQVLALTTQAPDHGTLSWVWSQWKEHKRYTRLAPGTQADYALAWKQIEVKFGKRQAASIKPTEIARYVHVDRAASPRRADLEKTVMSNLFKHAILLGAAEVNPTIGVEPHGSADREGVEMPQPAVLETFLKWLDKQTLQRRRIGFMAEYASLAGNRRCEFLALSETQIDDQAGVIRTFRAKQRGKRKGQVVEVVTITPPLKSLISRIRAVKGEGLLMFPNEDGNAYSDRGWKTLWQRCMTEAIKTGVIKAEQRFTFHALRHYYVTVHKERHGVLPDLHANPAVTASIYDDTKTVERKAL